VIICQVIILFRDKKEKQKRRQKPPHSEGGSDIHLSDRKF